MKYVIQVEIDPETGVEMEADMGQIQELTEKWQRLNPVGMYFATTRRSMTIIVDVPNEEALFEALHATWVATNSYPDIWPVVGADEFPSLVQRLGLAP